MTTTRFGCVLLLAIFATAGCTHQYTNYPEIPSSRGILQNPNSPAAESAMVTALQYVAGRYAPSKLRTDSASSREAGEVQTQMAMVVNLPMGLRRSYYERVAHKVGPNVVPMTADVDPSLPVYHVTRIWQRFGGGTVDVMRPMPELPPGKDGKPVYQTVTLKMEGGFGPWRVVHARAWEPGIDEVPAPYAIPEIDRIDQYNYTVHGKRPQTVEVEPWKSEAPKGSDVPPMKEPDAAPVERAPGSADGPVALPPPVDLPPSGPEVKPAEPK